MHVAVDQKCHKRSYYLVVVILEMNVTGVNDETQSAMMNYPAKFGPSDPILIQTFLYLLEDDEEWHHS